MPYGIIASMKTSNGVSGTSCIPNFITLLRVFGAVGLLFAEPFSFLFYTLYIVCGLSDMLDGYLARRLGAVSKFGQALDSVSDFLFIGIVLFIYITYTALPWWSILWMISIAAVRFLSILVGFGKYGKLAFLHTYSNKATGFALFLFPLLYSMLPLSLLILLLCSVASISALEELLINATSKVLQRDIKSIFHH